MRFKESLLLALASFVVLGGLGFVPYEINRRNDDNSIQFQGISIGNPRVSIAFDGVSYKEAEVLREKMKALYPKFDSGSFSPYYELFEGRFAFHVEGRGVLESESIVNYVVKNSGLSVR